MCLPASGSAGGILVAWHKEWWETSAISVRRFSLTAWVRQLGGVAAPWWITIVYGPQLEPDKVAFLAELATVRSACDGHWLVGGDFNMIFKANDKINGRLEGAFAAYCLM